MVSSSSDESRMMTAEDLCFAGAGLVLHQEQNQGRSRHSRSCLAIIEAWRKCIADCALQLRCMTSCKFWALEHAAYLVESLQSLQQNIYDLVEHLGQV